ncbi:aldehyde dehydrogenase [Pseudoflavitalea sp. G-6-1-2]|uniref:aldehyde dehydrogenase n=1 Tax=Pseudoflavitalea sp. G-6-1-2 TaxID=2728841 RepID=UPI00146BD957|nr:aldehyde dehydrogenase [Pseudoflavitalea sp. G-6-1-2]NML19729.1 aldehyde dehydrogenase [Pseudoflavitalea sp. G-6-1-2]
MPPLTISEEIQQLRAYFNSGATRSYDFRRQQLKALAEAVKKHENAIHDALQTDLKKNAEESWVTETGFVLSEIRHTLKNLKQWMKPQSAETNLLNFPSSSFVMYEPLGVVLIIGAWNYPFQLLMAPLISAIAAGNCAVLKPSENAPATAAVMKLIIRDAFPDQYVLYVEGDGAEVVPLMMNNFRFDHVFYTGGAAVGKLIYKMAAEQLVPVTLELGGKSPAIVEADADIKVAAKRIAATKFSNAGQMCIAPDYVLVHSSKKDALINALKDTIRSFYSDDPAHDYNFGKIINQRQFNRLVAYLQRGRILHGGKTNAATLYIEPTIIDEIPAGAAIMNEEIFGPILPVISFDREEEVLQQVAQHPNPLALYLFSSNRKKEHWYLQQIPFGGGCVNNTSWHFLNPNLPFGGRGSSGTGAYHGKAGFDTFSHRKSVMKTPLWFNPAMKFPPYKGKLNLFKKIIR